MSDDEQEITYTRRAKTIHYGSLEEQGRQNFMSDEPESSKADNNDDQNSLNEGKLTRVFNYYTVSVNHSGCI